MTDKYDIAKKIFDENIAKIELSYSLNKIVDQNYVCKTPKQTISDGYGFCSEQVELADYIFKQHNITVDKYQLFAVPKNNENLVKIDLAHSFIGIPNEQDWILFETGFRVRNRGGVKRFTDETAGLQYVLKLYNQSLIVAGINDLVFCLYQYDFSAINQKFSVFSDNVLMNAKRINIEKNR